MRGISIIFNNEKIHTGADLDLVQEVKEIGKPDVQTYTVQVPGRDGLINMTKSLTGKVSFYNRSLTFQYFGTGDRAQLLELDAIMSRYHGQTIRIIDDDHPNHYYEGEATVTSELHANYITITLEVDAQPFRLKLEPTVYIRDINGTVNLYLNNENIEAIPVITTTGEIAITFNGLTTNIGAGSYTLENLVLQSGVNMLTIAGKAVVTIEYQEGAI